MADTIEDMHAYKHARVCVCVCVCVGVCVLLCACVWCEWEKQTRERQAEGGETACVCLPLSESLSAFSTCLGNLRRWSWKLGLIQNGLQNVPGISDFCVRDYPCLSHCISAWESEPNKMWTTYPSDDKTGFSRNSIQSVVVEETKQNNNPLTIETTCTRPWQIHSLNLKIQVLNSPMRSHTKRTTKSQSLFPSSIALLFEETANKRSELVMWHENLTLHVHWFDIAPPSPPPLSFRCVSCTGLELFFSTNFGWHTRLSPLPFQTLLLARIA